MLKKLEKEAILKNNRILALETIYDQMPQFRDLESNKRCHNDIENINFLLNARRYILSMCYSKKMDENTTFDGTFNRNILVVGQTRC